MYAILKRVSEWKTDRTTVGTFNVYHNENLTSSIFRCYSLEDIERAVKVWGKTAVWKGVYEVVKTWSPKFKRFVLMLKDVKDFERVYMHEGNDEEDTDACILLGLERQYDNYKILNSRKAVEIVERLFLDDLARGKKCFIEIT